MQLIDNWRDAWRMASNIASSILGILALIQSDLMPYIQPLFPPELWPKVVALLAIVTIICRLIKQPSLLRPRPDTVTPTTRDQV